MTKVLQSNRNESTWTKRFIAVCYTTGRNSCGLDSFSCIKSDIYLKTGNFKSNSTGGAGTWFTFGYTMYVVVGVIGVAVSSLFYYYLEKVMGE